MGSVNVVVIDSHALLRANIAGQLDASEYINLVGEASTGQDTVELITNVRPDVAVVGPSFTDSDCVALLRAIRGHQPTIYIFLLSVAENGHTLIDAVEGAATRLSTATPFDLVAAVVAVGAD